MYISTIRIQYNWVKEYPAQNILIWLILLLPISSIRKQGKQPPALALILLGERRTCPQSCNFSEIISWSTFFTFDFFMFWFNLMSSGFVSDAWCLACKLYQIWLPSAWFDIFSLKIWIVVLLLIGWIVVQLLIDWTVVLSTFPSLVGFHCCFAGCTVRSPSH